MKPKDKGKKMEETKTKITLRLNSEHVEILKKMAEEEGISQAEVIEAGIGCIQRMGGVEAWKDFDEAFNPESDSNMARRAEREGADWKED